VILKTVQGLQQYFLDCVLHGDKENESRPIETVDVVTTDNVF
jgi:hypothetical protein